MPCSLLRLPRRGGLVERLYLRGRRSAAMYTSSLFSVIIDGTCIGLELTKELVV